MKRILFGLCGAVVLGATGIWQLSPRAGAATIAVEVVTAVADTSTVRLRIDGMTCGGCAISARVLLERMDGVDDANVDYESRTAVVSYDASKVTPEQMIAALRDALNYTAVVVDPRAG